MAERDLGFADSAVLTYRLLLLGENLKVAGLLCAAFLDGWYQGMDYQRAQHREISISDRMASMWRPGCGRSLL